MAGPESLDPRRGLRRPLRGLSINRLLPNVVTLAALCCGLTSVRYALSEEWKAAILAIIVAAILDSLDGRLARRLNAVSRFGAELDSLCDFFCFGVAPALIMYLSVMHQWGNVGWVICLFFPICSALRLARFNTALWADEPPPLWAASFFSGVPAPAGALLALIPLMLGFELGGWARHPAFAAAMLLGVGALMVSRLPTFSFKKGRVPTEYVLPAFLIAAVLIAFLIVAPWITMPALGLIYLAMVPLSLRAHRKAREAGEAEAARAAAVASGEGSGVVPLRPGEGGRG